MNQQNNSSEGRKAERSAYVAMTVIVAAVYVLGGLLRPFPVDELKPYSQAFPHTLDFGFSQLSHLGTVGIIEVLLCILFALLGFRAWPTPCLATMERVNKAFYARKSLTYLTAFVLAIVFYLLRNEFLNPDVQHFTTMIAQDAPVKGFFATHDELWEFYLHSKFWLATNAWFGWSVKFSYQVISSIAGGAFVIVLLSYCKMVMPEKPVSLALLIFTGGFAQLYFGDVENYTVASVSIIVYFYTCAVYLKGKGSILAPSSALGLAMMFHLLAGFLIPSLAYLFYLELKKKQYGNIAKGAACFLSVIVLTMAFFHINGLPIRNLYHHSHAFGQGGQYALFVFPSLNDPSGVLFYYYSMQANLAYLLYPCIVLGPLLVTFRRITLDTFNVHLIISSLCMLGFHMLFFAKIGVYNDWNLYANVAVPVSILIWYNVLKIESMKGKAEIVIALYLLFAFHSYSWIVSNHLL